MARGPISQAVPARPAAPLPVRASRQHPTRQAPPLASSTVTGRSSTVSGRCGPGRGVNGRCSATSSDVAHGEMWEADLQSGAPALTIREAVADEYWEIAEVHCQSFYPRTEFPLAFFVRLDRVLALHLGRAIEKNRQEVGRPGQFRCLVAAAEEMPMPRAIPDMIGDAFHSFGSFLDRTKPLPKNHVSAAIVVDTFVQYIPKRLQGTGPTPAYISNLAVATLQRRRGIGKALLEAAEMGAAMWGCTEVYLHCDPKNVSAYQLYENAGYVPIENPKDSGRTAQPRQDVHLVLMSKSLPCAEFTPPMSSTTL